MLELMVEGLKLLTGPWLSYHNEIAPLPTKVSWNSHNMYLKSSRARHQYKQQQQQGEAMIILFLFYAIRPASRRPSLLPVH